MIKETTVTKDNIHAVCRNVQLFLDANPHVVTTHDFDCGFDGNFDKYNHNPAHSCKCAVESDGICRIRMKRVNGSIDTCIITVGMAVVITDSYIAIKEKTNIRDYKFLYHLIYHDYAYRIAPNNAYDPENEWSYTIARNLPSGLRDIIEASKTYASMKGAPDSTEKMLQAMKIHNLKYDNPTAAAYIMLFGLSRSKFGLISRFARYACYITEQEDYSRKFLHESSIITNTWCNMMYDWLERMNSPLVDPTKGFFTIHKGKKMIVVSEQDVYNFLALITLSTDDSFFNHYTVGGRYKLYYTHTDLSTHTIRVMHETYQSPGENRLVAIDYGPLDTSGSMNIE
jgi:hypothetical protein